MRIQPTLAEDRLWQALRRKRFDGIKFRRQHAIGPYIVDFYCVSAGLVIELDGPIHAGQRDADAERQASLEGLGLTVLRFSNVQVLEDLPNVLVRIGQAIATNSREREDSSPLSSQGEGVGGEVTPRSQAKTEPRLEVERNGT